MAKNNPKDFEELMFENRERLKELAAINKTTSIIKENKPINDTIQHIALILPNAMQFPEHTEAQIKFDNYIAHTPNYDKNSKNQLEKQFKSIDNLNGKISIHYTKSYPEEYQGPYLLEEINMVDNVVSLLTGYINSYKAQQVFKKQYAHKFDISNEKAKSGNNGMQLFEKYLYRQNYDRDIFHDLMPFKVKEILLIATLYDAYSIEKEGRFAEHVLGEYQQLNLSSFPRITGVSTEAEALSQLQRKHFDLVIYMVGADMKTPFEICKKIKHEYPYIPVYFLVNNNSFNLELEEHENTKCLFDKIFYWNGEPSVFFAMVKHLEDQVNVDNDTNLALVRVILVVEDSPRYYSRYLPLLYSIVMEQTKRIIDDVTTDELYKVLKLRGRPKILLASNYEEAMDLVNKYSEYMLCMISDVKFSKKGKTCKTAGFQLVKTVRNQLKDLPIIIQSSDIENASKAYELKSTFIDKNSETLSADIRSFISHYLGFGNFVYRNPDGREIAIARTLKEFETHLRNIPDESLIYHARRNHFSLWLMARGEIQVAKILGIKKVSDFETAKEIREFLLRIIQQHRNEKNRGRIVHFEDVDYFEEGNIISLSPGSIGGKGRGISFINSLIYSFDFNTIFKDIKIKAPRTAIIGIEEFESFMRRNNLWEIALNEPFEICAKQFLESKLSEGLMKKLKKILKMINKPIAVRSSGLFEDSMRQPFAGIFETYLLPNSHPNYDTRLQQLADAIKMVYASVFSDMAKGYIESVAYKIEEEKMAIVIQEVVGNQYENFYYPHISGTAQSYNYYPVANMKPEEGVAVMAVGLGKYVVEGDRAYRFSPVYPKVEINSMKDVVKNSQVEFLAVDLSKHDINLLEGDMAGLKQIDIWEAEKHGTLKHCASVFDPDSNSISAGLDKNGPRIVNFANILKYDYIPLSTTITSILQMVKESMGSPVEIEFAIDLNKDDDGQASFYLLQIKPLIGDVQDYEINTNEIVEDDILLYAEKSMGNGRIEGVHDVIFVKNEVFDKTKTLEIAAEIEAHNKRLGEKNRKYLLIGPGRWGTRDRFIGIPVVWHQISHAKVIVETDLEDFPLEASMGSHFFHNVTSLSIGYFTINNSSKSYIKWDRIKSKKIVHDMKYTQHVRFENSIDIRMDGKKRIAIILENNEQDQ
ncbi:MAG: pyruvate, phosphate dikinase [Bacteroidales bacterium]|nr:pyruvate, phosphate dikinase [Bacteroidales bacterium]